METSPGEGVGKEKIPHNKKPSHRRVCGEFWNLRRQNNLEVGGGGGGGVGEPTEYMPNCNCGKENFPGKALT